MPKVSKTYSAPYNGISEQSDELVLDVQCKDMVNCIPDVVLGVQRRNGTKYVATLAPTFIPFHSYDRGEGNEKYIIGLDGTDLKVYDLTGTSKTVNYGNVTNVKAYLGTDASVLKAITVQDRTFIVNTSKTVGITTIGASSNYKKVAYYWLSRSSNDTANPYRYAVYIDGITFESSGSDSTVVAATLAASITAHAAYTAVANGSLIKITKDGGLDFTFSYWDSWGSHASFGFKGQVAKLSDLPNEITTGDNPIVKITGNDSSEFTTYYVQWNGRTWEETYDPEDTRGTLTNMPLSLDRLADGTFLVSEIVWETPNIGDSNTNPTPSFVGNTITEVFFFKNRLGISSGDNLVMSQTGAYYNFYSRTALEVLDTDPIDITISSLQASRIYDVTPFQGQLYMMTREEQFTVEQQGTFSPLGISVVPVSRYSVDTAVEPVVLGDSMFFLSVSSDTTRQLREYRIDKNSLTNVGTNVSITTPRLLPSISKMVATIGNSSVFLLDRNDTTKIYLYRMTKNGEEVVQSSWSKWTFSFNIRHIFMMDDVLYILKTDNKLLKLSLIPSLETRVDYVDATTTVSFPSTVQLRKWLPKIAEDLKTYLVPIQITRVSFYAEGKFDVDVTRDSYNYTYTRTFDSGSTANMSATVTSKSNDVTITIKNSNDENFILSSIIFEGFYTPPTKEIK